MVHVDDTRSTAKRCHTVRSTSSSCVHIGTIRSQVSGLTVAIMSRHSIVGCACPRERQHFQLSEISHFFQILTALLIQRIIAFCHSGNDASTIIPLLEFMRKEKRHYGEIHFINHCRCFKQLLFVLKNYTLLNSYYNYHYIIIRESFRIEINEWVYISWIKDRIILHSRSYCKFYIYKMFRDEMYLIEL